jgi:phosphoribosylamine--glycine ligase/phosphoribosylformylglycinamidine cyclo-ligase
MARHDIPTAQFRSFTSNQFSEASAYINSNPFSSGKCVIKASGLAAGKGVLIPATNEEAIEALKSVMVDREFGDAGDEVVIEECLTGPEISILAFCDGYTIVPMPAAQDHKRIGEGDKGPNTGGMGAYAPAPVATQEIMTRVMEESLLPTIKGMRQDGESFQSPTRLQYPDGRLPIRRNALYWIHAHPRRAKGLGVQRPIRRSRDTSFDAASG